MTVTVTSSSRSESAAAAAIEKVTPACQSGLGQGRVLLDGPLQTTRPAAKWPGTRICELSRTTPLGLCAHRAHRIGRAQIFLVATSLPGFRAAHGVAVAQSGLNKASFRSPRSRPIRARPTHPPKTLYCRGRGTRPLKTRATDQGVEEQHTTSTEVADRRDSMRGRFISLQCLSCPRRGFKAFKFVVRENQTAMRPRCERVVRGARRDRRYAQRRMATGPWAKCARRELISVYSCQKL